MEAPVKTEQERLHKWVPKFDVTPYVFLGLALVVLLLFLVYPLSRVLGLAFVRRGDPVSLFNLTLTNFERFWTSRLFSQAVYNSMVLSVGTMFFATILGVLYAYFLARVRVKLPRHLMVTLGTIPLVMPPLVGTYAWVMLLGRNGTITVFLRDIFGITLPSIYSMGGMIFAMTMPRWPFVFLLAYGALSVGDPYIEESAEVMGATLWRKLRTITIPLVFPAVATGAVIVFMRSIGNFGTPAILGGNRYVLPTLIHFQVSGYNNFNTASAIAVVSVIISIIAILVTRYLSSRRDYVTVTSQSREMKVVDRPIVSMIGTVACLLIIFVSLVPQLVTLVGSFSQRWVATPFPTEWGLANYVTVLRRNRLAIQNSLMLASLATVTATIFGTLLAYISANKSFKGRVIIDLTVMLPFIIPGIVMGVAILSAFIAGPIVLVGTWMILLVAYFVRRMPYGFRAAISAFQSMGGNMEEASRVCGATWLYTSRRVTLPLILPSVVAGAVITFITLLGELSATVILYSARWKTITIAIYEYLISNQPGPAFALGTILIVIIFSCIYAVNRFLGMTMSSLFTSRATKAASTVTPATPVTRVASG